MNNSGVIMCPSSVIGMPNFSKGSWQILIDVLSTLGKQFTGKFELAYFKNYTG